MQNNSISNINSNETKNILRGIIGNDSSSVTRKSLSRINKKLGGHELKKAIEVIRISPLFEANGVTREFNKVCPEGLPEVVNYTVAEIVGRINENADQLIELLAYHIEILKSLFELNYDDALSYCDEIIKLDGVTCYLLRCLFYVDNRMDDRKEFDSVDDAISRIYERIEVGNSRYLENTIRELSSSKTDYFNIYKRISDSKGVSTLDVIAKSFLDPIYRTEGEFNRTLSSYYTYSLLDSLLYLLSTDRFQLDGKNNSQLIDSEIVDKYRELSCININLKPYYEDCDDHDMELDFFKECFLLIEQEECFKYKAVHGAYCNEDENKEINRTPIERRLINEYFSEISTFDDLRYHDASGLNPHRFNSDKCSLIENSTALLFLIEKNDGDLTGYEDSFIKVMSYTRSIGTICPIHYFNKINENAENIDLKLVIACLVSIKDKSQIAEHSLRKVLQKHCRTSFNSSLKDLLSYLFEISPSVTEHLIHTCDETFLTKLFQMINTPNMAIADRASMLEWYGKKIDDNSYIERAKNLKIDVQISKEKGTIDDARIYVDPLKFTQWINDNIINEMTLLLRVNCGDQEIKSTSINWDTVNSGLSHTDQIATLILHCFKEFCTNNLFGIASYLGRRIRHGTFKGTGLKDVKELCSGEEYSDLFQDKDFLKYYQEWLKKYEEMFEMLKKENLHFKTKRKSSGLFNSSFNTRNKKIIASQMYMDIHNSYVKNDHNLEIPYLVTEYCWRIIEEDLSEIRRFLMEKKSSFAIFKSNKSQSRHLSSRSLRDFSQEVNSLTTGKFRTITTWFNKPSIASPSADLILLFRAVTSEVKGLKDGFFPKIECETNDFPVNGGQYFAIYDALYVLIFNAASYGVDTGEVKLKIELFKENKYIKISITSEVKTESDLVKAEELINEALESDFVDAHIIEGRSGIKKLKQLEKDKYINSISYNFITPNKISASFNYTVEF